MAAKFMRGMYSRSGEGDGVTALVVGPSGGRCPADGTLYVDRLHRGLTARPE